MDCQAKEGDPRPLWRAAAMVLLGGLVAIGLFAGIFWLAKTLFSLAMAEVVGFVLVLAGLLLIYKKAAHDQIHYTRD
jgi:hypothetical protein